MSAPLPTVRQLIDEVRSLPNLKDLEGIFHIGWEEGAHEIFGYMNTPNGAEILADELNKLSAELGRDIPFYLITGAPDYDWPHEWDHSDPRFRLLKIVYYPTYFFQRTIYRLGPHFPYKNINHASDLWENYVHNSQVTGLDIADLYTGLDKTDYKYTYLYMVLYPKTHRCIMMDMLAKHDLHQHGALSWMEYNRNINRAELLPGQLDSQFEDYVWKYWKEPKRLYLDQQNEKPGPIRWDWLPSEYSQSFMQVIGESVAPSTFITEKTVVPLYHNKPFLIAGSKGNHRYLTELGFKLYDEIFDYSFDDIEDQELRYEGIAENVKRVHSMLEKEGSKAILDKIRDKLIYNKDLAHRITITKSYIPDEIYTFLNAKELVAQKSILQERYDLKDYYPYFEYSKEFYNTLLKK